MVRRQTLAVATFVATTLFAAPFSATFAHAQQFSTFRGLSVLPEQEIDEPASLSSDSVSDDVEIDDGLTEDSEVPSVIRESDDALTRPSRNRDRRGGNALGADRPMGISAFWSPEQNVRGGGDFSMSGQSANLGFPVSVVEGHGAWIAIANVSRLEISTSATLPQSGLAVPDELWSLQAGALHMRELGDGWTAGGMLLVGSASDEPFEHGRDLTFTAVGFLNVPSYESNEWRFSVFYSPTSQLPYPIPGIAYVWRPDERWDISIGVPLSATYRPTESLTLQASWRPLTNVEATATQELAGGWSLSGGYRTKTETFWLAERIDDEDRLFLFDQRLFVGLGKEVFGGARLEVGGAYLFDRRLFQADDFAGSRADGLGIEPGFLGTVQLTFSR